MRKRGFKVRNRLAGLLTDIKSASIAIVGDIILDEYIIGDTDRISPEAPEPIILEQSRTYKPGGAANVAVNITALGAKAHLIGIIGDDSDGEIVRKTLNDWGVDDSGIISVKDRPTCRKTRMIARGNQVLRVDRESKEPIDQTVEKQIIDKITQLSAEIVIVSDYAKGTVSDRLVSALADAGKKVIADPKSSDFAKYRGAYIVTPNLSELSAAAGIANLPSSEIETPARTIMDECGISNMLVTCGPDGMALIEKDKPLLHIHAKTREVYDVTGAGDTVIATMSSAVSGGATLADACFVANIAAGIVVGKHQTAATTPDEILSYAFGPSSSDKIIDKNSLIDTIDELKKSGKKIVFTNGCFDILHMGHITYLNEARGLGDILVVGLNTDRSVRALKGDKRPILPEQERSHILAALECIDYVVMFDEDTPFNLIEKIRPDILAKGADYSKEEVVGHDILESYGGKVALLPLMDNISTTNIIDKIKRKG
ncbi:D-glycero-beta-D-manno-heptose 1-phosphate adenylyltransferase [Candidatus Latescibacterota bacterium]